MLRNMAQIFVFSEWLDFQDNALWLTELKLDEKRPID